MGRDAEQRVWTAGNIRSIISTCKNICSNAFQRRHADAFHATDQLRRTEAGDHRALPGDVEAAAGNRALRAGAAERAGARHRGGHRRRRRRAAFGDGALRQRAGLRRLLARCSRSSAGAWSSGRSAIASASSSCARASATAVPAGATGVLHQSVSDAIAELGHLEESVKAAQFNAAIRLIAGAPRIHVLAQRRAFPVACYLAYALSQLELRTHLLDGVGGMLSEVVRGIAAREVLIAVSFRNYSPGVIEAAADCHRRGVPVIAITDSPLSPLKANARDFVRAGRRLEPPVPVAGGAAVPRAGARGQHRAPAGRNASSMRAAPQSAAAPGQAASSVQRQSDARRSTSSASAAPPWISMASRSAGGWRTC